ncbi:MAG: hypothetical protein HC895_03435 [Leptolyngbyaceae cyanobacterium SM1_3_5]|nr:hypothetical protein [Leptolyngbyaceae cyanobacterium SM1_3_5]
MLNLAYALERSPDSVNPPRPASADVLDAIKQRAIAKWGEEKWMLNLVREYVRLEGEGAKPVQRRSQIARAFETGSCTLETAMLLANAIGCKFQLNCIDEF